MIGGEVELEDSFEDRDADEITNDKCCYSEGEHGEEEFFRGGNELLVVFGGVVAGKSTDEGIDEIGAD